MFADHAVQAFNASKRHPLLRLAFAITVGATVGLMFCGVAVAFVALVAS